MFDSSTPSRKGGILCAYSIGFDASSGTWLFVESCFFENLDNPCPLAGSWESVWRLMHGLLQIDCWCALPVTWDRNSQKRLEETYPAGCERSNSHYWEVWTKHTILIAIYHNLLMWCGYPKRFVMFFVRFHPPSFLVKVSLPSGVAASTSWPCCRQVSDSSSAVPRPPRFGRVSWQKFPWNDLGV